MTPPTSNGTSGTAPQHTHEEYEAAFTLLLMRYSVPPSVQTNTPNHVQHNASDVVTDSAYDSDSTVTDPDLENLIKDKATKTAAKQIIVNRQIREAPDAVQKPSVKQIPAKEFKAFRALTITPPELTDDLLTRVDQVKEVMIKAAQDRTWLAINIKEVFFYLEHNTWSVERAISQWKDDIVHRTTFQCKTEATDTTGNDRKLSFSSISPPLKRKTAPENSPIPSARLHTTNRAWHPLEKFYIRNRYASSAATMPSHDDIMNDFHSTFKDVYLPGNTRACTTRTRASIVGWISRGAVDMFGSPSSNQSALARNIAAKNAILELRKVEAQKLAEELEADATTDAAG